MLQQYKVLWHLHKMQGAGVECFMVMLSLVKLMKTQFVFLLQVVNPCHCNDF
jgi:hypothetical protein